MHELSMQLASAWHETSWIELTAAVLAVAYLLLAIAQRSSCWIAAFISSCMYIRVFFVARLYMDAVLYLFYAVMAVYGFREWKRGGAGAGLPIVRWPPLSHLAAMIVVLLLSWATSALLIRYTNAVMPFFDSLEMWASMYTTFLVARKVYENWHWWLVIDSLSVGLYYSRRLYATTLLLGVYLVLIVIGLREWRRALPAAHAAA